MPKSIIENLATASRKHRRQAARHFLNTPSDFGQLLQLTFDTSFKYYYKAAWVFEFVVENDFKLLFPYLDFFAANLSKLQNDSAIRPVAKICNKLAIAYVKEQDEVLKNNLSTPHIEQIVNVSFDWLIGDYKVAPKVYAMETLYYFGCLDKSNQWIHEALKDIIQKNIHTSSKAYQSRGKKILRILHKS